jgi:hypothetical protein
MFAEFTAATPGGVHVAMRTVIAIDGVELSDQISADLP